MADPGRTFRGVGPEKPLGLFLLPDRNSPERSDWSGAFRVEAARAAALHQVPPERVVQIDVSRPREDRLRQVLSAIDRCGDIDFLALFCHGWKGGVQIGPYSADAPALVEALKTRARQGLAVALYACSAGDGSAEQRDAPGGEGGCADALRDALLAAGIDAHVDAHTCKGHCCRNAFVRRFSAATATGGEWLVAPSGPLWQRWHRQVHETDLRFRYPLMSIEEIRAELGG
jgi:hypothetical protein